MQVTQLLGKPLHRNLGPVRDLTQVEGGWGLCIMPPPLPRGSSGSGKDLLTFVSARMGEWAPQAQLALHGCSRGEALRGGIGECRRPWSCCSITSSNSRGSSI